MPRPCEISPYTTVLTGASRSAITIHSTVSEESVRCAISLLQCAGVAAIVVALIHGVLGETKVFARATIEPPRLRTLIRLVWQAGTVAWIGGGVLLVAAPSMASRAGAALDRRHNRLRLRLAARWPTPGGRAAGISAGWR